MSFSIKRLAGIAVVATGLSVSTYAFTAANTVDATKAGSGSGAITGYAVTGVDYVLNTTTPTSIDSVTFTLDSAADDVQVQLVTDGPWYPCTVTGTAAECTTAGATAGASNNLTVVAAD